MHHEKRAYAGRVFRQAARELAASDEFDPEEASRYAAVADHLGFFASAEVGGWSEQEMLAASPVVVMPLGATVPLVELLARRVSEPETHGREDDVDLVELAKLLLQGLNWRIPEGHNPDDR